MHRRQFHLKQQAHQKNSPPTRRRVRLSPTPGRWPRPHPVVSSPLQIGSTCPAWPRGGESLGSPRHTAHDCGRRAWRASAWCRYGGSRRWRWGVCLRGNVRQGISSDWPSPGWAPSTGTGGFLGGTLTRSCPGRPGRRSRGARSPEAGSTWCSSLPSGLQAIHNIQLQRKG